MEQVLVLNGLRSTRLGDPPNGTLSLTAGNTTVVSRVSTYSLPENPYVSAQKNGTDLSLVGLKAGQAQLIYQPLAGTPVTLTINVTGLSTPQALALANKVWTDVKSVLNEPTIKLDWQDAEALRVSAPKLRQTLQTLANAAGDLGNTNARDQALRMITFLDWAVAHPETTTLLECIVGVIPGVMTLPSYSRAGAYCKAEGGETFARLRSFAADYTFALDAAAVAAVIASALVTAVGTIVTVGAAGAAVKSAAVAASSMIPTFAANPKDLVHAFGIAICKAINDGALPARVRAALVLRSKVTQKWGPFTLARRIYNDPGATPAAKASALTMMAGYVANAQAALVGLQTLDQPAFFASKGPEADARFKEAAAGFRALDVLHYTAPTPEDTAARSPTPPPVVKASVSPAVVAGGGLTLAFLLWRFLSKAA